MLSELRTIAEDLNNVGAQWALVGALAVSVYVEPRSTRDIDVAVVVNGEKEREELLSRLLQRGWNKRQVLMHLEPTHRLGDRLEINSASGLPVAVDLLSSSSGIEAEIVAAAQSIELLPGITIPVASRGHLIAMKSLSQNSTERIRDRWDLQHLLREANPTDLAVARSASQLIAARGFSRGKAVEKELEQIIAEHLHSKI